MKKSSPSALSIRDIRLRVSIVTTNLNQGEFLEQCILSVLNQTHSNIEYILIDGASTDGSLDIIRRYERCLAYSVSEADDGPADAYQKGFGRAGGDVFAFLNADDLLLPRAVERAVAVLAERPDVDVAYANAYIIDRANRVLRTFVSSSFMDPRLLGLGALSLAQQATFWRREVFERVGGFNVANRTCWDAELWADLSLAGARFRRVPEVWACFRHHTASISGSGRLTDQYLRDLDRIFRKVFGRDPTPRDRLVWRPVAKVLGKLFPPSRLWGRWLGRKRAVDTLLQGTAAPTWRKAGRPCSE